MSRDDGDDTWKRLSSFFQAAQKQTSLPEAVAGYAGDGYGGDGYGGDGHDDGDDGHGGGSGCGE